MRTTLRHALICWLITVQLLAGCARREPAGRFRIVVIPKGTTHAFWQAIHAGALKAAKERGVEVVWDGPPREDDRQGQQNIVERHTSEGVDALVLAPCDRRSLVAPTAAALKKGIRVVIIDSGLEESPDVQGRDKYLGYIATDNEEGGRRAGERMRKLFEGKKAKVIMLRYQAGSESTELREKGFEAVIRKAPNIDFHIAAQEAGATVDSAQKAADNLLQNFPDVDGIFAPNESSTTGVLQALRAAKRAGEVKLVGFDGSEVLISALKAREVHGLVLQDPFEMGYLGVMRAVDALEGRPPAAAERTRHTRLEVATPENVDQPNIRALYAPDLSAVQKR
jgi:ribose transport system substrate-binding protein